MLNGDATQMAEAWSEAQQQMWDNWLRMMESTPVSPEEWRKLTQQSMQLWLDQAEPTARRAAEQMINSQQAMLVFLQTAAAEWQSIAARINDGEDWQTVLEHFNDRLRTRMSADNERWAAMLSQAAQMPVDLWGSYLQPWAQLWQDTATRMGATPMNGARGSGAGAFGDLIGQTFDAYQQTFGRFLDTPPLGYAREYEEKLRGMAKAVQEYSTATLAYQSIMGEAWANGMSKLMESLVKRSQEGKPIRSLQELSDEWATIADPAFFEIFVSDDYVRAQGALLSATMRLRIAQRKLTEQAAQALDMPTRTEVDAAHKMLYAQRRELRALKQELAAVNHRLATLEAAQEATKAAEQQSAAAKPAAKSTRTRKKSSSAAKPAAEASSDKAPAEKSGSTRKSTAKSGSGQSTTRSKRSTTSSRSANGSTPKKSEE